MSSCPLVYQSSELTGDRSEAGVPVDPLDRLNQVNRVRLDQGCRPLKSFLPPGVLPKSPRGLVTGLTVESSTLVLTDGSTSLKKKRSTKRGTRKSRGVPG